MIFTQYGAVRPTCFVELLDAPELVRRWNVMPLAGVTNMAAYAELFIIVSRIITPALDHGSVFCTLVTLAMTSQSPEAVWLK
jgi:hypothetical protein